jgi:AraC-like DNA-binding protein
MSGSSLKKFFSQRNYLSFARGIHFAVPHRKKENSMISLVLASERLRTITPSLALLLDSGKLNDAVTLGRCILDRSRGAACVRYTDEAVVGQAVIRSLLALGREEDAEDLMGSMLKVYQGLPRKTIRWYTAIDQAVFMLHLNKPARATQFVAEIADDESADVDLRVEVLLLLAESYIKLGRQDGAFQSLEVARRLASTATLSTMPIMVDLARTHVEVYVRSRSVDELNDHDQYSTDREATAHPRSDMEIQQELNNLIASRGAESLVGHQATQLRCVINVSAGDTHSMRAMHDELAWVRTHSLSGIESSFRVDAGIACLGARNFSQAYEFLKPMTFDEHKMTRHRYAVELEYCVAKLHAQQGRHSDALRFYKMYSCGTLAGMRGDSAQIREPRCTAVLNTQRHVDAVESRLPVRYRRAYRYLIEHLDRPELSVRQVAAHIGVTERALQLAFNKHLGMTPAEVIRKIRMEHIHAELIEDSTDVGVLEVAARWGVTNRSTLAHRYRQMFSETPTDTRRGGLARAEMGSFE